MLPERIYVSRVMTYSVRDVIDSICEMDTSLTPDQVTLTAVCDYIQSWVDDDFARYDTGDLVWQDDNGNEI